MSGQEPVEGDDFDPLNSSFENSLNNNSIGYEMQDNSSLSTDMEQLFSMEHFHDVFFQVGIEKEIISAHKCILAARCPYFYNMFTLGFKETNSSSNDPIKKPNISSNVFREVLRFLYCGKVTISSSNVVPLIEAAGEMELPSLKKLCLRFIENHIEECFESELFLTSLSEVSLIEILQSDYLNLREEYLFEKVVKWGKLQLDKEDENSSLRDVLNNVIEYVRFPLIKPEYLLNNVEPLDVVPHELIFEAYKYYATNETSVVKNRRAVLRGDEGRINPNRKGIYVVQVFKQDKHVHYRWQVKNFSKITKKHISSPAFQLAGQSWKVLLYPKGDSYATHISVFLSLVIENVQQSSCYCDFTLRIVNQKDIQNLSVEHECFNEHFQKDSASLGRQQLLSLERLHDPQAGFLVDDTLYVDVIVKVL
ncbi:hypothetical protein ABK040_013842 [Willaertia magna]